MSGSGKGLEVPGGNPLAQAELVLAEREQVRHAGLGFDLFLGPGVAVHDDGDRDYVAAGIPDALDGGQSGATRGGRVLKTRTLRPSTDGPSTWRPMP